VPPGTPNWGAEWKQAVPANYLGSYGTVTHGGCYSHRGIFLDLDPTDTDAFSRKVPRLTFDFHENERRRRSASPAGCTTSGPPLCLCASVVNRCMVCRGSYGWTVAGS
jgi:hypothetical protein